MASLYSLTNLYFSKIFVNVSSANFSSVSNNSRIEMSLIRRVQI